MSRFVSGRSGLLFALLLSACGGHVSSTEDAAPAPTVPPMLQIGAWQCPFLCPPGVTLLAGAKVGLLLSDATSPASTLSVSGVPGAVTMNSLDCSCVGVSVTTSIDCLARCGPDATLVVEMNASLTAPPPGAYVLEVVGPDGAPSFSSTITTEAPATLTTTVAAGPTAARAVPIVPRGDGTYAVHVSDHVLVAVDVYGATGNLLYFSNDAVAEAFSDPSVLVPDTDAADQGLASTTKLAIAAAPGVSTMTASVGGAFAQLAFDVSP